MINISRVNKVFGDQIVLKDINLQIKEGEILVILGQSGSGKTVLLQHLIGILKPDTGTIEINSVDICQLSERKLLPLRKDIGYLFQEGALFDFANVYDNVAFPLEEHTKMKSKEIGLKVCRLIQMVGLEGAEYKFPSQLSGGMKKRAALARSVILDPKILFCDEPTSGLDPIRSREISDLIRDIAKQLNTTTVITSHDIENSFRIADRIALIHEGRIVLTGTKKDIASSNDSFVKSFFAKEQEE